MITAVLVGLVVACALTALGVLLMVVNHRARCDGYDEGLRTVRGQRLEAHTSHIEDKDLAPRCVDKTWN